MEVRPERQAQEENAIASGISGPDAKACKVPVIAPGLVASKRVDQDKRSLRDWLVPRTGKRLGSAGRHVRRLSPQPDRLVYLQAPLGVNPSPSWCAT